MTRMEVKAVYEGFVVAAKGRAYVEGMFKADVKKASVEEIKAGLAEAGLVLKGSKSDVVRCVENLLARFTYSAMQKVSYYAV